MPCWSGAVSALASAPTAAAAAACESCPNLLSLLAVAARVTSDLTGLASVPCSAALVLELGALKAGAWLGAVLEFPSGNDFVISSATNLANSNLPIMIKAHACTIAAEHGVQSKVHERQGKLISITSPMACWEALLASSVLLPCLARLAS